MQDQCRPERTGLLAAPEVIPEVLDLATRRERAMLALTGADIADRACVPMDYLTDAEQIDEIVDGMSDFGFLPESHSPVYRVPKAHSSSYGQLMQEMSRSLCILNEYDKGQFEERVYETFGVIGSEWLRIRENKADMEKPVQGPWMTPAVESFLDKYDPQKPDDDQVTGSRKVKGLDAFAPLVPLLGFYASKEMPGDTSNTLRALQDLELGFGHAKQKRPAVLEAFPSMPVTEVIAVFTKDQATVARCIVLARLLWAVLTTDCDLLTEMRLLATELKDEGRKHCTTVSKEITAVIQMTGTHRDVVLAVGQGGDTPASFQAVLHTLLHHDGSFKHSVMKEMWAGGNACCRALISGAILAAETGDPRNIPTRWQLEAGEATKRLQETCNMLFAEPED